jgi:ferric iron reductase protein FhuF
MTAAARELCTRITSDSDRFATSLIDFITRLYPTTKKTSGLSDEVIWELCIELLAYILDEIVKARNGFSDAGEAQPAFFFVGYATSLGDPATLPISQVHE